VLRGGDVAAGDPVAVLAAVSREAIQAAVLTVSDRCSPGEMRDPAGPAVAAELTTALAARVAQTGIVPDETDAIVRELTELATRRLDLVVTVGGTGCGPRDVTPEATRRVIERELPGLAEAMRAASTRITPHALLQRGIAGIRHDTLIINLPGSERAALENLRVIVAALPHAGRLLRGEAAHAEADRDHAS
jgi:molybdenum cofactor synthesis domain-containing protein